MDQAGRKDVHVAIPEACGDYEACAVDHFCAPRDVDIRTGANRENAAVVDQDGAVLDWWVGWGRIDLCANQSKIRSATRANAEDREDQSSSQ